MLSLTLLLLRKPQILLSWHDAGGVCMPFATAPALDTDNKVAFAQDTELDSLGDAPYQALVNILLPIGILEIGLALRKEERIDTAVEV